MIVQIFDHILVNALQQNMSIFVNILEFRLLCVHLLKYSFTYFDFSTGLIPLMMRFFPDVPGRSVKS